MTPSCLSTRTRLSGGLGLPKLKVLHPKLIMRAKLTKMAVYHGFGPN